MRAWVEQALMGVLAVEVDQFVGDRSQRACRGQRVIDVGSAPALGTDLAADQHLAAVGPPEDRFDGRGGFTGADEAGGCPRSEQEPERADDDRFSGAGFARENGQAGLELELEFIDHGQMLNAKEPDHGRVAGRDGRRRRTRLIERTPMLSYI